MQVSIIIVSYNTKDFTRQCLLSVFDKTCNIDFEVVVVDNASQDGSPEMIKTEFPQVTLVESAANIGFGKANNLGAAKANGKYLFLLNPDTVLRNNAVKILADFMDDNPDCGICGGNLFNGKGKPTYSFGALPTFYSELKELLRLPQAKFNYSDAPLQTGFITGADLMIQTDLFRKLNGFDTDFFMYCEDVYLAFLITEAGFTIYSVPQAEIIHWGGQSLCSDNRQRNKMRLASKKMYFKKNCSGLMGQLAFMLYRLTIFTRFLVHKNI